MIFEPAGAWSRIHSTFLAYRSQLPFRARITYCAERDEADHYPAIIRVGERT
jgi:hypothetical protein